MYTAAQLRLLARAHRERAEIAPNAATAGMLSVMAAEFERDAESADREERRERFRLLAARQHAFPTLTIDLAA